MASPFSPFRGPATLDDLYSRVGIREDVVIIEETVVVDDDDDSWWESSEYED